MNLKKRTATSVGSLFIAGLICLFHGTELSVNAYNASETCKYQEHFTQKETQKAIKLIKDSFEQFLAEELSLTRVSSPLFVASTTGLNDNLSGTEKPVSFTITSIKNKEFEIVHSLAKWKRMALGKYDFKVGEGLYTDMNAIRREEDLDDIHSVYVDQWDWELVINKEDRTEEKLKEIVRKIFNPFKKVEQLVIAKYPQLTKQLPDEIFFISSQELEDLYPGLSAKERENSITKKHGAVFITQIGKILKSGTKHDTRSPDYDDWSLNGDILLWSPVLNKALELSSMGIRVDEETLKKQLKISNSEERLNLNFHKMLINGELPYTVGGGIGQSRLCMYFLQKAHIGQVQVSEWNEKTLKDCEAKGIKLL